MELAARQVEFTDLLRLDLLYALTGSRKLKSKKPVEMPRPQSVRPKRTASQWVKFAKDLARTVRKGG